MLSNTPLKNSLNKSLSCRILKHFDDPASLNGSVYNRETINYAFTFTQINITIFRHYRHYHQMRHLEEHTCHLLFGVKRAFYNRFSISLIHEFYDYSRRIISPMANRYITSVNTKAKLSKNLLWNIFFRHLSLISLGQEFVLLGDFFSSYL